jgi:hypothetical protein
MAAPDETYLTFTQMAKLQGVPYRRIYWCCRKGLKAKDGSLIKLEAWKRMKGWCTTQDALGRFHDLLNRDTDLVR